MTLPELLAELTRTPGVRGALVASLEDGLVVADALMETVDGKAVAALAASLSSRMNGVTTALGQPEPLCWQLQGSDGVLLAAPGREGLLIVAIADAGVNTGELRLRLLSVAERAA